MDTSLIPRPIIQVVSEVLNSFYTHDGINTLFLENGTPDEVPQCNKINKCVSWFLDCNNNASLDPCKVLGGILQTFMEVDRSFDVHKQLAARERINSILGKYGLSYHTGGLILGASSGISTRTLHEIIKKRDLEGVEQEFQRALGTIESDPPAGLTAACSIVESLCKIYIEDEGLTLPSEQSIKPLWKVVSSHLGFQPSQLVDDDLKKILSGLFTAVEGLGSLRTHGGSAPGRGRKAYKIQARHARLAAHTAHTLCVFILETWLVRKEASKV